MSFKRSPHVWPRICVILTFLLNMPAYPSAQPVPELPISIAGQWQAAYEDFELGPVSGEATISEDEQSATVTYTHPETAKDYTLTSTSIQRDGNTVIIALEGESPSGRLSDGLDLPYEPILVHEGSRTLEARYADSSTSLNIAPRRPSDLHRITLEFKLSGDHHMGGRWMYTADPVTKRDTRGYGRHGRVYRDADGRVISQGYEHWRRKQPVIYGVFPIENQLAYDHGVPAYRYPFGDPPLDTGHQRYLFIFGENLPTRFKDPVSITNDDAIRYGNPLKMEGRDGNVFTRDLYDRGFKKLLESLPDSVHDRARLHDALIIRADLNPQTLPGYHTFTLNGVEAGWLLQFSDNTARAGFTRAVRQPTGIPRHEWTQDLFLPEDIYIDVRTNVALPVEEIAVTVGVDGRIANLTGSSKIIARRVDGETKTYRTKAVTLKEGTYTKEKTDHTLYVQPSSTVTVSIAQPGLISIDPPPGEATVWASPQELRITAQPTPALTDRMPSLIGAAPTAIPDTGEWKVYLKKAYACSNNTKDIDWSTLDREQSEKLVERIVFSWEEVSTRVDIGDHAAMIYLRQTFLGMLQERYQELDKIKDFSTVLAFRRYIEPYVGNTNFPIGDIAVQDVNGAPITFAETFLENGLGTSHRHGGFHEKRYQEWLLKVTRYAIEQMQADLIKAHEHASTVNVCDVEDLLQLTAPGFQNVTQLGLSRLMEFETDPSQTPQWKPHYRARGFVKRIPLIWESVKLHENLSDFDSAFLQAGVALFGIPVMMYGGTYGMVAGLAIDVIDIASTTYEEISEAYTKEQEVAFALAAAHVLGEQRKMMADEMDASWVKALTMIFLNAAINVLTGADDVLQIYKAYRIPVRVSHVQKGRDIAAATPAREFPNLEPQQQAEVLAFVTQARANKARHGIVDELEDAVLNDLDEALEEAFQARSWLEQMDADTARRMEDLADREDIQQLMSEAAPFVQNALRAADGEDILTMIRYAPFHTQEQLQNSITAMRNRIRDPQGEEFFRQANETNLEVTDRLEANGWVFDGDFLAPDYYAIKYSGPNQQGVPGDASRSFDDQQDMFIMNAVFRNDAPMWIREGLDQPLVPGRGTPTIMYVNMRLMQVLDLGYAGRSGRLIKKVKIEHIINPRSAIQLEWMRRTYFPEKSFREAAEDGTFNEYVRHSFSAGYAEDAMTMAGYRVTGARIELDSFYDQLGHGTVGGLEGIYNGRLPFDELLRRYGMDETDEVNTWYNIILDVEPY